MTVRRVQHGTSQTDTVTYPFVLKRYAAILLPEQLSLPKFLKPNLLNIYPNLYAKISNEISKSTCSGFELELPVTPLINSVSRPQNPCGSSGEESPLFPRGRPTPQLVTIPNEISAVTRILNIGHNKCCSSLNFICFIGYHDGV